MSARKILWSLVAILSTTIALSSIADELGQRHADEAFQNALITFAIARTLNGVISVAQGTELALEPGGVGVVLTLGQVLDPINDLVERFSAVMLVATSSIGLQNILLRITAWWGITLALAGAACLTLLALWWPRPGVARFESVAIHALLIMVFLRFAVPALVISTALVFDQFLAEKQVVATTALETTRDQIELINEQTNPPNPEDSSLIDRLGTLIDSSLESINLNNQLERLSEDVANSAEHIIDLIVIFVLQTILLPLGFLWFVVHLLKSIGARVARL
ncbi:MAG: hypothetical protein QGH93_02260 [Gammaproteobacteria bacterium]|jgi:hypothetical protein|nr:hypothetical protein [Gammaproteobacteria bacterium]